MHVEWNNNDYFNEHPTINDQAYKHHVPPNMIGLMAPDEKIDLGVFVTPERLCVYRELYFHWCIRVR